MNIFEGNLSVVSFSPRDYQVELVASALERNVIACLSSNSAREFCALKLIQEFSFELRRNDNRKITLFLTNSTSAYNLIYYLTDLKVLNMNDMKTNEDDNDDDDDDEEEEKESTDEHESEKENVWEKLTEYQVIILETKALLDALECNYLDLNSVNLIIVDDCHHRTRKSALIDIFINHYNNAACKPKVFGLAGPLHSAACSPARLGAELEYLETLLSARAETASDIVTVLR
jgi:endoribonuclease Dicer